jgi:hypothetical protein
MSKAIHQKVIDLINEKYKILEILNLGYYDCRLAELNQTLQKYQNHVFSPDERIIILHHDTDYYHSNQCVGNNMYNIFHMLAHYDIPMEFVIMFTNHYSIEKELQHLCQKILNRSTPQVIYTMLFFLFPENLENLPDPKYQEIKNLYCCLNGVERMHRVLTLAYLKEYDLLDQGVISYHFKK